MTKPRPSLSAACPPWCSNHELDHDPDDRTTLITHRATLTPHAAGRRLALVQTTTLSHDGAVLGTEPPQVVLDDQLDAALSPIDARMLAVALTAAADRAEGGPAPSASPQAERTPRPAAKPTGARPPRTAYTPREVADRLGVPYTAVLRLIRDGELNARKTGAQRYVVPVVALDAFIGAEP